MSADRQAKARYNNTRPLTDNNKTELAMPVMICFTTFETAEPCRDWSVAGLTCIVGRDWLVTRWPRPRLVGRLRLAASPAWPHTCFHWLLWVTGLRSSFQFAILIPHLYRGSARVNSVTRISRVQVDKPDPFAKMGREQLRNFNKQIEEDKKIINSRNNLIELHNFHEEHVLSCLELLHLKTNCIFLTKQKAEKVVGRARNHYLFSVSVPSVSNGRLLIPHESLEIAISRLWEQESISTKISKSIKNLAKDEYESNFVSAIVPSVEIGVKFDDTDAIEDVKRILNELVTLPMRRLEFFSQAVLLFGPAGIAPVIIFINEVDSLLGARGGAFEHEATTRMLNEFMAT
ncbi:hypothetical protein IEQ34_013967 [Dendrobium chrysotoxum]|uniref:DUF7751 domain-containing protein n=1 Tax=Dendrobium chrysotoxum TaxID=161865 RepID=A0AAV7G1S8_DENCH|nr:hypothetical protein IEQ34_013967 [Dendrobium chrysotoxum]